LRLHQWLALQIFGFEILDWLFVLWLLKLGHIVVAGNEVVLQCEGILACLQRFGGLALALDVYWHTCRERIVLQSDRVGIF
jgi:hypothetical protein